MLLSNDRLRSRRLLQRRSQRRQSQQTSAVTIFRTRTSGSRARPLTADAWSNINACPTAPTAADRTVAFLIAQRLHDDSIGFRRTHERQNVNIVGTDVTGDVVAETPNDVPLRDEDLRAAIEQSRERDRDRTRENSLRPGEEKATLSDRFTNPVKLGHDRRNDTLVRFCVTGDDPQGSVARVLRGVSPLADAGENRRQNRRVIDLAQSVERLDGRRPRKNSIVRATARWLRRHQSPRERRKHCRVRDQTTHRVQKVFAAPEPLPSCGGRRSSPESKIDHPNAERVDEAGLATPF